MAPIRFGVNGWRARVDQGFDEAAIVRVASALGSVWSERGEGARILVGYDTRRDSRRLALAAGQVLASFGLEVAVSTTACPAPALSWTVARDRRCVGGVMLTAFSLPCEYGGVVACGADGGPLPQRMVTLVAQRIEAAPAQKRGEVSKQDIAGPYLDALVREGDTALIEAAGLSVVVDTLHGAGSGLAQRMLEGLGCTVHPLHADPVPDFRGLHPSAHEPWVDDCEREVLARKADMGLVLDGACERLALIDERGRLVSQHVLAPLVLDHLVSQRGSWGRVVGTVSTSARVFRQAERLDCDHTMVPVGFDSLCLEFGDGDVILATDESGAVCVPAHAKARDGLVAAAMLAEYVAAADEPLSELVCALNRELGSLEYVTQDIRLDPASAQRLRNMLPGLSPEEVLHDLPSPVARVSHVDGLRAELEDGSWMLLRPSRSGRGARIVAEARGAAAARSLAASARSLAP